MNKKRAVNNFLEHVEQLSRLPLITDAEMYQLYGEEVAATVVELDGINREKQICINCQSRCCPACACELYAPQFSQCPIYNFRPVLCRLHFCHRFNAADRSAIVELGDIFFDSLMAAEQAGSDKVRLFESPPLAVHATTLVAATTPLIDAVKRNRLDSEHARSLITQEAEKYHALHTHSTPTVQRPVAEP